jgi:flagellar biosynthetic protein FliQ
MTSAAALDWITRMLWVSLEVAGLPMLILIAVAFVVSVLQAATQVNDAAVGFAPKLVAIIVCMVAGGEWILDRLVDFTTEIFTALATVGQGGGLP